MSLIPTQQKSGYLYLSGVWLSVDPRMDTKNMCIKKIGLCAQFMLIILGAIVNMIWGGGPIWPLTEDDHLHFDDE